MDNAEFLLEIKKLSHPKDFEEWGELMTLVGINDRVLFLDLLKFGVPLTKVLKALEAIKAASKATGIPPFKVLETLRHFGANCKLALEF